MSPKKQDHDSPMRFGVIGLGVIGAQHVARLSSGKANTTLVAVADNLQDAARKVASDYSVEVLELKELLRRDDIDSVVIAVPSGLHADIAVMALENGKHVLLEKPIDVTVDAADRIIAAEDRSGKTLSIVSQRRFAAANQFIQHAIKNNDLGRITSATFEVALWRSQEYYDSGAWRGTWALDGGGALMNQGVHLVDLALWLLGDAEEVFAYTGLLAHERIEVEDTVAIVARMANGALLNFVATTAANNLDSIRYGIFGSEGSVIIDAEEVVQFSSINIAEPNMNDSVDQQLGQLNDFIVAATTGSKPVVTSRQARAAVSFIEAVYESGRTGQPVKPR